MIKIGITGSLASERILQVRFYLIKSLLVQIKSLKKFMKADTLSLQLENISKYKITIK